jgi:2'-5' RNA ligase
VVERVGRLFFGLALPAEAIAALSSRLEALDVPGGVVPPGNWHLTLRFIGEVDQVGLERLLAEVDQADLGDPFRVRLGEMGAFSRPQRAEALWLGLAAGEEEVKVLGEVIEEATQRAGFPAEDRPLHPHLTLSRMRPPRDVRSLMAQFRPTPIQWQVEEVVLFTSRLGRGGARYEQLEAFPLGD